MTSTLPIQVDVADPARDDVRRLLQLHRDWSHRQTPCQYSHAMTAGQLADSGMTVFAARSATGELLGVVALKQLSPVRGEVKSMHTAAAARGRGVGRALLNRLLAEAGRRVQPLHAPGPDPGPDGCRLFAGRDRRGHLRQERRGPLASAA